VRRGCAAAAIALSLALTGSAAGAPQLDQQQPTLDTFGTFAIGGSAGQRLAQTITPAITGTLTEVQLPVRCQPGSQLVLEIRTAASAPESSVLASQLASVPVSGTNFHAIPIASPPFLVAEDDFAVVLSSSGSCDIWPGPPDSYPRGRAFSEAVGGSWFPFVRDLAFKTFVEPGCRVPNVVGMPADDARRVVVDNGCATGPLKRAYSRRVPTGAVISQSPAPGTVLGPGSPVALVVSRGPPPCIVPRLRGKTLRQARRALTRANCRLGRVSRRPAAAAARGRVVGQRPSPGRRLRDRGRVNVVLGR
jgi:hypothetical protein